MNLKQQVLYCLKQYPESRNSDITLTIKIWQNFTKKLVWSEKNKDYYVRVKDLFDMPREDNIKRWRAKIQNDKENPQFLPTDPEVIKARRQEAKMWREELGYNKPNK